MHSVLDVQYRYDFCYFSSFLLFCILLDCDSSLYTDKMKTLSYIYLETKIGKQRGYCPSCPVNNPLQLPVAETVATL